MTNEIKTPETAPANSDALKAKAEKQVTPEPTHKEKAHHSRKQKQHGNGFAYFLIFIVAAGTGAGAYWFWKQQTALLETMALGNQQTLEQQTTLQSQISANKQAQETTLQQFQVQQKELDTSLKNLYDKLGNTTRDWVLAEADYLLEIANYRLALEQDIPTAIVALKLADQRIRMLSEPSLLKVRNTIAKEITALETLNIPDTVGIAMSLNSIVEQIEHFPLRVRTAEDMRQNTAPEEKAAANGWRDFLSAVWHALKSLVTVRYNDKPTQPLLAPEEVSYLKQNVKLKIEQAQLALLQHNQTLYQQNLGIAANWINTYFETSNPGVANTAKLVTELSKKSVSLDIPDISESKRILTDAAKRINLDLPYASSKKKEDSKP